MTRFELFCMGIFAGTIVGAEILLIWGLIQGQSEDEDGQESD